MGSFSRVDFSIDRSAARVGLFDRAASACDGDLDENGGGSRAAATRFGNGRK